MPGRPDSPHAHRKLELAHNPELADFQAAAAQLLRADHDIDQHLLYFLTQTKLAELRGAKKTALLALKRKCEQHPSPADVKALLDATKLYDEKEAKPVDPPTKRKKAES